MYVIKLFIVVATLKNLLNILLSELIVVESTSFRSSSMASRMPRWSEFLMTSLARSVIYKPTWNPIAMLIWKAQLKRCFTGSLDCRRLHPEEWRSESRSYM